VCLLQLVLYKYNQDPPFTFGLNLNTTGHNASNLELISEQSHTLEEKYLPLPCLEELFLFLIST
jgi:hypothetical protein